MRITRFTLLLPVAALAALVATGCATTADMDLAFKELASIKRNQQRLKTHLSGELESRSAEMAQETTELTAAQLEIRAESDARSSEVARVGAQISELQRELATLSEGFAQLNERVKDIQNTQAIGLGSLSGRLDDSHAKLSEQLAAQEGKLETFGTQVAKQVDGQDTRLKPVEKNVGLLLGGAKRREGKINDLTAKLDKLGKMITAELADQSKRIDAKGATGGAPSGEVTALKAQVDFLGEKIPPQIDKQGKQLSKLAKDVADYRDLLADLNKRFKALEGR